ncbi:coiled-coil domain-containing protein 34 [Trichosurus vulpecula]|uniref:coiled-coil domain-containing protein 34 n=1 Tax=Trichosurus vulpecula TaxID=9337 RepID=UPI00186B33C8|nr:coiled-coil domain-containing protein 34 [Trichosurus vulpecula]
MRSLPALSRGRGGGGVDTFGGVALQDTAKAPEAIGGGARSKLHSAARRPDAHGEGPRGSQGRGETKPPEGRGGVQALSWQRVRALAPDWLRRRAARCLLGARSRRGGSAGLNLAATGISASAAGSVRPPLPLPRPAPAMNSEEIAQPPPRRQGEAPGGFSSDPPSSARPASSPASASLLSVLQSDGDGAEERRKRRGRRQHRAERASRDWDEVEAEASGEAPPEPVKPERSGAEEKAPPPPVAEEKADPRGRAAALEGGETSGRARIKERENSEKEHQWLVLEASLTPWEEWFVCKEKEQRARLQNRALEELSLQQEKRKEVEEREKRKKYAEEKHKEWLHKKNEQERKEREKKLNKEMEEKAAKDLEKEHLQEKAKEKYKEWLRKKMAEEHERKKKEKEKEKQRLAEQQEKKEISEKKFKEWLQNVKNKPRLIPRSYGYANGKLTGYYNGIACPPPSFYNPIPWKPIYIPPPKESKTAITVKKSKRPVSIQPYRSSPLVFHKNKGNLCLGTLCRIQR